MNLESYSLNKNGLIEMHRDVILSLLRYVKEPSKVRALIAVSQEIYCWKSHHVFLVYRWENTGAFMTYEVKKMKEDYLFRIILLGDPGSGKSALLFRYTEDKFNLSILATIGVDFRQRTFTIDNKTVKVQFWDASGQDRFRTIAASYYRGVNGAIIFFDITMRDTFRGVVSWLRDLGARADPSIVLMLVGCKCDLSNQRKVSAEEAAAFAQENGMLYAEATAKQLASAEKAFNTVIQKVFKNVIQSSASIYRKKKGPLAGKEKKQNMSVVFAGNDNINIRKPGSSCV